jgi:valyl-tRNA synthetase
MELLQNLVVEVRALRKEIGVEEKVSTPIELRIGAEHRAVVEENHALVERLARVSEVRFVEEVSAGVSRHNTAAFEVGVVYERTIDVHAERLRLTKEIAKLEQAITNADRQLNNPGFTSKAPSHVIEGLKKQRESAIELLNKLRKDFDSLPE